MLSVHVFRLLLLLLWTLCFATRAQQQRPADAVLTPEKEFVANVTSLLDQLAANSTCNEVGRAGWPALSDQLHQLLDAYIAQRWESHKHRLHKAQQDAESLRGELQTSVEQHELEKQHSQALEVKYKLAKNEAAMNKLLQEQSALELEAMRLEFEGKMTSLQKELAQLSRLRSAPAPREVSVSVPSSELDPACVSSSCSLFLSRSVSLQDNATKTCGVKECAMRLSEIFLFSSQAPINSSAAHSSSSLAGEGLGYVVTTFVEFVKYEYRFVLSALSHVADRASSYASSLSRSSPSSEKPPPLEGTPASPSPSAPSPEANATSPSLWHEVRERWLDIYYAYLDDYYAEYLEERVESLVNGFHIVTYYTWRFFDDTEELQENVQWAVGRLREKMEDGVQWLGLREVLGERTDTVVFTVIAGLLVILVGYFRKPVLGLLVLVGTIALLPVLVVCYGLTKLPSLLLGTGGGRKKVKQGKREASVAGGVAKKEAGKPKQPSSPVAVSTTAAMGRGSEASLYDTL